MAPTLRALASSPIPTATSCREGTACIGLDSLPNRIVLRPDKETQAEKRADCAIFYSLNRSRQPSSKVDGLLIVELKTTARTPLQIVEQLENALRRVLQVTKGCGRSCGGFVLFCIVARSRSYSREVDLQRLRVRCGRLSVFVPIWLIQSNESIRDLVTGSKASLYSVRIRCGQIAQV